MEIKVAEKAIFKITPKEDYSSEQLSEALRGILGEDNIFAPFSVSVGYYVWTLPEGDWRKKSEADEMLRSRIDQSMAEKISKISKILNEEWPTESRPGLHLSNLFQVPSDDYILYRIQPDGSCDVMLAAWDYKLPAKPVADNGPLELQKINRQDVVHRFVEDDKPVVGYKLVLKAFDGSFVEKETDAEGCYKMPGLGVGQSFTLKSLDRERDFSFTVESGVSEYIHDLTGELRVYVIVKKDGCPLGGENVMISYAGIPYEQMTGDEGTVSLNVPYRKEGDVIVQIAGAEAQVQRANYPENVFRFELESSKAIILVRYTKNGKPYPAQQVVLNIEGRESLIFYTNERGETSCETLFQPDKLVSVRVGTFSESKLMEKETLFEFNEVFDDPLPPEDSLYHIFVKNEDDRQPDDLQLSLTQGEKSYLLTPEEDGVCRIRKAALEPLIPVSTIVKTYDRTFNPFDMVFEEAEDEYEIILKFRRRYYLATLFKEIAVAVATGLFLLLAFALFWIFLF